jgi:hypothetical protein
MEPESNIAALFPDQFTIKRQRGVEAKYLNDEKKKKKEELALFVNAASNLKSQNPFQDLKETVARLEEENNGLRRQTEVLEATNAELKQANNVLSSQNGELNATNAALRQANDDLSSQMGVLKATNMQLEEENLQLGSTIIERNKSKKSLEEENQMLQGLLGQLKDAVNVLKLASDTHIDNARFAIAHKWMTDPFPPAEPPEISLDNDETMGDWGQGSIVYRHWLEQEGANKVSRAELVGLFVDGYLAKGAARPNLKDFLKKLYEWKENGLIKSVSLYTSAFNTNGWVTFIQDCMAKFADVPDDLFGPIQAREHTAEGHMLLDGRTRKVVARNTIIVDDKIENTVGGYGLGVSPYKYNVRIPETVINAFDDKCQSLIRVSLRTDEKTYPVLNNLQPSDDRELSRIVEFLESNVIRTEQLQHSAEQSFRNVD